MSSYTINSYVPNDSSWNSLLRAYGVYYLAISRAVELLFSFDWQLTRDESEGTSSCHQTGLTSAKAMDYKIPPHVLTRGA